MYPDFQPTSIYGRRNALREELERKDMLERRANIDIPEFYVGQFLPLITKKWCIFFRTFSLVFDFLKTVLAYDFYRCKKWEKIDGCAASTVFEIFGF